MIRPATALLVTGLVTASTGVIGLSVRAAEVATQTPPPAPVESPRPAQTPPTTPARAASAAPASVDECVGAR